jgi:membrane-associated phospholipid phosphatase
MIGCTSLAVFVLMFTSYLAIPALNTVAYLILCMGFVASSRLYMKAHTPLELIAGIVIGGLPQILVWFYNI